MNTFTHLPQEWDHWLDRNLAKGCLVQDIVKAMVESRFDPDFAARTVTERVELRTLQAQTALPAQAAPRQPYQYGLARFAHAGNVIPTFDRDVHITFRMQRPVLAVLDDLLTHEECDRIVGLARDRLQRSATLDPLSGQHQVKDHRTSMGVFLPAAGDAFLDGIERRIAEVMNWPRANGEPLHVLHYDVGAEYRPHHDFFDPAKPGFGPTLARGGQRVSTLITYLNEVEGAGETIFPALHLSVVPKKGSAVYFEYFNESGQLDWDTLHGGAPVTQGEKWVVTKWMREGVFS
ncbi:2OG-Fe(II) oxygenase [Massilia sp. BJB1822]|uniref:2OG-Fe(II) oxygenase n=1 Tax=Massilia sp. BJB1822 TaxID=2744470 RepID=UPI001594E1A7|nr:2OG-Fe(II) oxygenase [Massilia sp. BJB1822]NVE00603.1 2OG-Fe(II) oxygenase [Massilia sp. BJB1822]